jgi:hypothetical protein
MQSFLGKINYLRRLVPRFAETVNPHQDMIKKDAYYKWGPKEKESFTKIKEEIVKYLTLMSPIFCKYFILYNFTFDIAFAIVLTHKNVQGNEFPISFMSSGLQGVELDYLEVDRQAYVVFKVVKHFSHIFLNPEPKW